MHITEMSIDLLHAYENNPRDNTMAIEKVANSIQEFGFKVPVVIDKENVIVCGHTRVLAARRLGLETVPCIVADDLNPEQIKAFRLADNKVAELSNWDWGRLDEELAELANMDMSAFGFTEAQAGDFDIENFLEEPAPKEKDENRVRTMICPHCGKEFEIE